MSRCPGATTRRLSRAGPAHIKPRPPPQVRGTYGSSPFRPVWVRQL